MFKVAMSLGDWLESKAPEMRRKPMWALASALAVFAAALAMRFALRDVLPHGLPFITFFVAVVLGTLLGGSGGGLLVTVLSAAATWSWFPVGEGTALAISLFFVISLLLIGLVNLFNMTVERLLSERQRAESYLHNAALAEQRLEQLNDELRHRNKNVFSVISTLITQSARHSPTTSALATALRGRLSAMAVSQDIVLSSNARTANMRSLATDVLTPMKPPGVKRLSIEGADAQLPNDLATPIGLVLHELATNCIKYGAWSVDAGSVKLAWRKSETADAEDQLIVSWEESGGPNVSAPTVSGMGSVLIERGVPGAKVERQYSAGGFSCAMEIPLPEIHSTGPSRRA